MAGVDVAAYAGMDSGQLFSLWSDLVWRTPVKNPEATRLIHYLPVHPGELTVGMPFVGQEFADGHSVNTQGWLRDPNYFLTELYKRDPTLFQGRNLEENLNAHGQFDGHGGVYVDEVIAERFPQYRPFLNEKMAHHHIGEDGQAALVPESVHSNGYGVIHNGEKALGVTENAEQFSAYRQSLRESGEDAGLSEPAIRSRYYRDKGLAPVSVSNEEIQRRAPVERVLKQPLSDEEAAHLDALRVASKMNEARPSTDHAPADDTGDAEFLRQVGLSQNRMFDSTETPAHGRARTDAAAPTPAPRAYLADTDLTVARLPYGTQLVQLGHTDGKEPGDYFVTMGEYQRMTGSGRSVNAGALSDQLQIAPYGEGLWSGANFYTVTAPEGLRVAIGQCRNNPGYGEGGGQQVILPDARQALAEGGLSEGAEFRGRTNTSDPRSFSNTRVPAAEVEDGRRVQDAAVIQAQQVTSLRALDQENAAAAPGTADESARLEATLQAQAGEQKLEDTGLSDAVRQCPMGEYRRYLEEKTDAHSSGKSFAPDPAMEAEIDRFVQVVRDQTHGYEGDRREAEGDAPAAAPGADSSGEGAALEAPALKASPGEGGLSATGPAGEGVTSPAGEAATGPAEEAATGPAGEAATGESPAPGTAPAEGGLSATGPAGEAATGGSPAPGTAPAEGGLSATGSAGEAATGESPAPGTAPAEGGLSAAGPAGEAATGPAGEAATGESPAPGTAPAEGGLSAAGSSGSAEGTGYLRPATAGDLSPHFHWAAPEPAAAPETVAAEPEPAHATAEREDASRRDSAPGIGEPSLTDEPGEAAPGGGETDPAAHNPASSQKGLHAPTGEDEWASPLYSARDGHTAAEPAQTEGEGGEGEGAPSAEATAPAADRSAERGAPAASCGRSGEADNPAPSAGPAGTTDQPAPAAGKAGAMDDLAPDAAAPGEAEPGAMDAFAPQDRAQADAPGAMDTLAPSADDAPAHTGGGMDSLAPEAHADSAETPGAMDTLKPDAPSEAPPAQGAMDALAPEGRSEAPAPGASVARAPSYDAGPAMG
ncbi:MAG: hypothetical protein GX418_10745 [Clostridiales bacterium]|nr:hypothetical protein [Clostridiales bacterium]